MKNFKITNEIREKLKPPLGRLLPDYRVSELSLRRYFRPNILTVTVGDRTTEKLSALGFVPSLQIIDHREQRSARRTRLRRELGRKTLKAKNEQGCISSNALGKIRKTLVYFKKDPKSKIRIVIDGEEDLLVLPVLALFPEGTTVFYGQPNEGLVIVASRRSRERALNLLGSIGITALREN